MSNRQNFPRNQGGGYPREQGYNQRNQGGGYPRDQGHNPRNQDFRGQGGQQFNDRGDNRSPGGFRGRGRGRGGSDFGGGSRGPSRPHVLSGEGAIFPINVVPGSFAYRYDVEILHQKTNPKDGETMDRLIKEQGDMRTRQLCYAILSVVMEQTENFGNKNIQVVYDNQTTMYVSSRFSPVHTTIVKDDLPDEIANLISGNSTITINITPNEKMDKVDLSDYSQYESRELLLDEDQTVRQVLEMILSQGAVDGGHYTMFKNGQLYRNETNLLERGFCTRVGTQKGVRMIDIEEKNKKGEIVKSIKPALVIDFKKSPFYCNGNFLTNVLDFIRNSRGGNDWAEAEKAFKGLKVSPVYQKNRVLRFSNFTKQLVSEMSITMDEGKMSLVDFYTKKKHYPIKEPNFPAATCGRMGDFPLEVLTILPDQRVDLQFIPPYIRDRVHQLNAVEPQQRYDIIMDEVHNLNFNNGITSGFGISLEFEPVKATVLRFDRPEKPKIKVGGGRIIEPDEEGRFNLGRGTFYSPAKIDKLIVLFPGELDGQMIKEFVERFVNEAKNRGITFQFPPKPDRSNTNSRKLRFSDWSEKFEKYKEDGVQCVMFIDKKSDESSHKMLKLVESHHKIITQHVTEEVVRKVVEKNQNITLNNILLKFNVKNGGINYVPQFSASARRLDINTGNILVIGYDVSHPTGTSFREREERAEQGFDSETKDPSVVGITVNSAKEPSIFVGDFFYQATRKESLDREELRKRTKNILTKIAQNRKLPEVFVILRDGISEGQFKMACEEELPAIQKGCFDFNQSYKPKFLFIITTKRHHKRFFEGENGEFSNPMAGSFVDNKVVRPDCIEFFMACHKAIKGTAKFVQVSVVRNDPDFKSDEIKHFLHSLCYGHQIVTSPTSLPTPIYIADELATRGSEIYNALKEDSPNFIPWKKTEIEKRNVETGALEKIIVEEINYLGLTHMLSYSEGKLSNIRFNA
ncbi:hypothetical protein FO519_005577 [Halicephalobus sp. NKZ332]|nr:hypothetical protein FO519_005577 [Halicephalobus sp. NKZ332]